MNQCLPKFLVKAVLDNLGLEYIILYWEGFFLSHLLHRVSHSPHKQNQRVRQQSMFSRMAHRFPLFSSPTVKVSYPKIIDMNSKENVLLRVIKQILRRIFCQKFLGQYISNQHVTYTDINKTLTCLLFSYLYFLDITINSSICHKIAVKVEWIKLQHLLYLFL